MYPREALKIAIEEGCDKIKTLSANNIDIKSVLYHIFRQVEENKKEILEENMATIQSWEVSDTFWGKVEPLIPTLERDPNKTYQRKAGGGRKPIPLRKIFEAILYVLRPGCQWQALSKERFGSPSAIHTHFMHWMRAGFFVAPWRAWLAEYDEMEGIAWSWQSIDGAMIKAPLARQAVCRNPTDRGKKGNKRHLLTDGRGVPLSIVVTGANRHDVSQLELVLDEIVIERPEDIEQHLRADKGYSGEPALKAMKERNYIPHVKQRGEEIQEKRTIPGYRTRGGGRSKSFLVQPF